MPTYCKQKERNCWTSLLLPSLEGAIGTKKSLWISPTKSSGHWRRTCLDKEAASSKKERIDCDTGEEARKWLRIPQNPGSQLAPGCEWESNSAIEQILWSVFSHWESQSGRFRRWHSTPNWETAPHGVFLLMRKINILLSGGWVRAGQNLVCWIMDVPGAQPDFSSSSFPAAQETNLMSWEDEQTLGPSALDVQT